MKAYFLIIFPLLCFSLAHAQRPDLNAAKVTYLTTKLNLTEQQAKDFWPIYNEFAEKRKKILMDIRTASKAATNIASTDEQLNLYIKQILDLRQSEIDLEKSYLPRFQKVITIRQVAGLFQAEKEFTRMVLTRLGGRRKHGGMEGVMSPEED